MERRKRLRFVERNEVCITPVCEKPNGGKVNGFTYDLSTGGARILTKDPLAAGTLINVRVDLARTRESVVLAAEVRWARYNDRTGLYELGVEFHHLSSQKVLSLIKQLYGQNGAVPSTQT
jgi:c-di-GMP-binding flagellar brake protein YcgR